MSKAVIYSILHEEPEPISAIQTEIPAEFEAIVNKCLRKERSDRYQNAEALLKDLKRLSTTLTGFKTLSGLTTAPKSLAEHFPSGVGSSDLALRQISGESTALRRRG